MMERETIGQEIPRWFAGHTHTLLEAFLNMSLRSVSFSDKALSGKKQNFQPWNYYPPVPDY
jgi:hypothetical protein